jgi:hypothetical protein
MTNNEPKCILLKRKGASRIRKILNDKNFEEELLFWQNQTEKLKKEFNKPFQRTANRRR